MNARSRFDEKIPHVGHVGDLIPGLYFSAPGVADRNLILPQDVPAQKRPEKKYADLIIGYAQFGAESEWRAANTLSIKDTAEKLGVELRFLDAQQKQENQILAIRKFIIQVSM
jgi:ABC-type sugar transport system substrate-binding protein